MSLIQDMPSEILEQIIVELDPLHVGALSQTCSDFATFIYYDPSSHALWRNLYLAQPLDDPRKCMTQLGFSRIPDKDGEIDWKGRLQKIIRARTVVQNLGLCREGEKRELLETLLGLVRETRPAKYGTSEDSVSLNLGWLAGVLRGGAFIDFLTASELSAGERQLVGELRTHFGLTKSDFRARKKGDSRGIVYAMRNYRAVNDYGPYLRDGSGLVDWELVDKVHHVMSMHIVPTPLNAEGVEVEEDKYIIYEMSLPFCQSEIPVGMNLDEVVDWAGIAGLWECSFCFCDHRWLLLYNNFNLSDTDPLQTTLLYDMDFQEAHRTIHVELRVVSTEVDVDHPKRPRIYFDGVVEGSARMAGWVAITPDGHIRWCFSSGEDGNMMWSSEGIQIGGVRSTFGVLGIWTTSQHDRHDPVGPFWMRKLILDQPARSANGERSES